MEVVKAGEALESQILEDARAKAARILAEADKECAALRAEWKRKTDADAAKLDADRDARLAAVRQELAASLPLDFMRARLSYIQEKVDGALADYFAGLAPADLDRIIGGMLRRIPPVLSGASLVVSASGISVEQARRIVEKSIAGVKVETVKEIEAADRANVGVLLASKDGRIRFRGTLREIGVQLLEQHREELAVGLLGRDV